jgi:hypothetical protein
MNTKISAQQNTIRSLRRKNQLLAQRPTTLLTKEPRKMRGGASMAVKSKAASQVQQFLVLRFSSKEARQMALYEHFRRCPEDYSMVAAHGITQQAFDDLCTLNPEWLVPVQKDVVKEIQKHWSDAVCLSIQIHCKVGHGEKYQDLIHLLAKTFNKQRKGWDRMELY